MSLSRCGESIDEPYPANHPVDASDCKRALDSGVRRCKHSLGANIPFAAMSFLWRQLCRSARLSVYSEEGARCDSRIHARRKVVVSMLPAGWVAPLPCLFRIYRMHRLTNLAGCFWSASSHCIWTSTNG